MFTRCYAFMYDRISRGSERAGLRDERAALLAQARGDTVEIGAGTGLNLAHYPAAVTNLTLVEPDQHMRKRLRRRVAQDRPDAIVLDARAETLPVQNASFDTVVASFVLCSVDDQTAVLDEIARAAASRSAALPRTRARRGSEDREETGRPAVPLLLDGVPSEPSHPGRDHPFEAVRRGRSPWCGPERTRDRAADGARQSHAERRLMARCRNTHAMTFTTLASWCRPVDEIIHRKLFPLQLDSRWFSSQVCFPLELGRGGRSGSGDSNGRHGSYMRFSDVEVRA